MRRVFKLMILTLLAISLIYGCRGKGVEQERNRDSDEVISNPKVDDETKDKFVIYDVDTNTYHMVEPYDLSLKTSETLEKKVNIVVDEVIKRWFPGLEYKTAITKEDDKEIVIIDLIDGGIDTQGGWYSKFQGSTGGIVSSKRIVNNILQKDYEGEWIQGVKVLYNGEKAEFEHAPELENTIYNSI